MDKTVVILKPDAIQRNLIGKIITMFEEKGFKIIALKMFILSQKAFAVLYSNIADKPYYQQMQDVMLSGPCIGIVLEGLDAIQKAMKLCGPSDLNQAEAWTIRGKFTLWTGCDVIHRSDSVEEVKKAMELIFGEKDICQYQKIDEYFMSEAAWESRDNS